MPQTVGQIKADKRSKARRQADFLAYFGMYASVSRAAKKAKVSRSNHYEWLKRDEEYEKLFNLACEQALGALEDEAVRRAYEGVLKPIYQSGKKVGSVREYSDTLMIVLLKARAPEKYRERFVGELHGKDGKDLFENKSDSELISTLKALQNQLQHVDPGEGDPGDQSGK